MTSLVNEKKVTEDSISFYTNANEYYQDHTKEQMHAGLDSTIWKKTLDSSFRCYANGLRLKDRLKELDFSIDSLTKMK